MVTTSYEQPGMQELHSDACKSNITILNEVGLDPGIDHMWASKMIDQIKEQGGKIEKFISVCGALPSPEALDNPFRYKFSWSPLGVLKASNSEASFLKNGQEIHLSSSETMRNTFSINVDSLGELEAYPNRNALQYIDLYQVQDIKTFFRGTFRYKGWCEILATLNDGGFLSEKEIPDSIETFSALTANLNKLNNGKNLRDDFSKLHQLENHSNAIMAMEWIGLFSNNHFSRENKTPIAIITNRMAGKMKMLPSDKDMVILNHRVMYKLPNNGIKILSGTFKMLGKDHENTAIANTVSYPAALATELLLKKKIAHKGVIRPFCKEIYDPILNKLKNDFKFDFAENEMPVNSWPKGW